MKKYTRLTAFLVSVSIVLSCFTATSALTAEAIECPQMPSLTQNQSHMYSSDYTLTGNYADDLVIVAKAQLGKTGTELRYTEAWCANFVNDTARLTNMPDSIIPYNYGMRASCAFLYQYMINNCNAKVIDDPRDVRTGDLVFYYCPTSNYYLHVGLIEGPLHSIEGNYDNMVQLLDINYNYKCYIHKGDMYSYDTGHVKRIFVRPNYSQPPKLDYTSENPDDYNVPQRALKVKTPVTSCGYDVCWTQAVLRKLGYKCRVTGEYTSETEQAVRCFRADNGLSDSGELDSAAAKLLEQTWKDLKNPLCDSFKVSKESYTMFDTIEITAEVKNYDSCKLTVKDSSGKVIKNMDFKAKAELSAAELGEGSYKAFITLKNKYTSKTTEVIDFTVERPVPTTPQLLADAASSMNAVVFSWNETTYTKSYTLTVNDKKGSSVFTKSGITNYNYSLLLPKGDYTAVVTATNEFAQTDSEKVKLSVNEGKAADLGDSLYAHFNVFSNKSLSLGASGVGTTSSSLSQSWLIERADDSSYTIRDCKSGKYLSLTANGNIKLSSYRLTDAEKWLFAAAPTGECCIIPFGKTDLVVSTEKGRLTTTSLANGTDSVFVLNELGTVHNFEIDELVLPTCDEDGKAVYHCILCGEVRTIVFKSEGHLFGSENECVHCSAKRNPTTGHIETPDSPAKPISGIKMCFGDLDNDGEVTSGDALISLRAAIGLQKITEVGAFIADVDCDEAVTSADSLFILRQSVGLDTECSAGNTVKVDKGSYMPSLIVK